MTAATDKIQGKIFSKLAVWAVPILLGLLGFFLRDTYSQMVHGAALSESALSKRLEAIELRSENENAKVIDNTMRLAVLEEKVNNIARNTAATQDTTREILRQVTKMSGRDR